MWICSSGSLDSVPLRFSPLGMTGRAQRLDINCSIAADAKTLRVSGARPQNPHHVAERRVWRVVRRQRKNDLRQHRQSEPIPSAQNRLVINPRGSKVMPAESFTSRPARSKCRRHFLFRKTPQRRVFERILRHRGDLLIRFRIVPASCAAIFFVRLISRPLELMKL